MYMYYNQEVSFLTHPEYSIHAVINCGDLPDITNGEVTYTPPRSLSATLPVGKRYTGTIATYSCSSGYQLIGSSLRACGADGTWNGTTTSCGNFYCLCFHIQISNISLTS